MVPKSYKPDTYTISAEFKGDGNYIASNSTGTLTIQKNNTKEQDNNINNNPAANAAMKKTGIPIITIILTLMAVLCTAFRKKN